jgi:GNAT superfamily N-acetyltransferase
VTLDIREVDLVDEAALHAWWQAGHAAYAGRPIEMYPPWEQSRHELRLVASDREQILLAAFDDGVVAGAARLVLPLLDNTGSAIVEVMVPPDRRRRGIGTAVLGRVEEIARERGRRVLMGEAVTPPGQTSPGVEFAEATGYAVVNRDGLKALDLDDHPDWAPLDARVAGRIGDYGLVHWENHTPDEHVDGLCAALSSLVSMIPLGDLALEEKEWTPERLRAEEARSVQLGRRVFATAAIAPDGTLAAYTDATVEAAQPTRAGIDITYALPEHRGRSLGLAVKLAHHRRLRAAAPACRFLLTDNADSNVHMNAVNEALGYRLVEQLLEVQKELP